MAEQDPDDLKLVTLARSARARNGAAEGAAVRDDTGRTYVATPVLLQGLTLTAVQAAIAAAVSSGAGALEAVALVGAADAAAADRSLAAELAAEGALFLVADAAGAVTASDPL
jgi:cytidine deaminase